jgi:hypothetical protein
VQKGLLLILRKTDIYVNDSYFNEWWLISTNGGLFQRMVAYFNDSYFNDSYFNESYFNDSYFNEWWLISTNGGLFQRIIFQRILFQRFEIHLKRESILTLESPPLWPSTRINNFRHNTQLGGHLTRLGFAYYYRTVL